MEIYLNFQRMIKFDFKKMIKVYQYATNLNGDLRLILILSWTFVVVDFNLVYNTFTCWAPSWCHDHMVVRYTTTYAISAYHH